MNGQEIMKIPNDVLIPKALKMRAILRSDPDGWVTYDFEAVRSWCGVEYGHVPTDDVRRQLQNLRKSGDLGTIEDLEKVAKGEVPYEPHNDCDDSERFSVEYRMYLESDQWKDFAGRVREWWDYRCAICNSESGLEVHHRTYERLGREQMNDCILLCAKCHVVADRRRQRQMKCIKAAKAAALVV